METIGPGSLKIVSGWSPHRSLRERLELALLERIRADDLRYLHGRVFLVYTDDPPAAIRDWLIPALLEGESVFVAEFERWSAYGPSVDRKWLGFRGH